MCGVSQNLAHLRPPQQASPLPMSAIGTPIPTVIKVAFQGRGPQKLIGSDLSTIALEYLVGFK